MKKRKGFVSNSSITSFTLFGVVLNNWDEARELAEKTGLQSMCGKYDDYVGLVLSGEIEHGLVSDLRDDETKEQFMQRVVDALPENLEPGWYTESFYDG